MIKTFRQILKLLGREKSKLPFVLVLFILLSVIDLIGVSILLPVGNYFFFGSESASTLLGAHIGSVFDKIQAGGANLLAVLVLAIFTVKMFATMSVQAFIVFFVQKQRVILGRVMLQKYLCAEFPQSKRKREADQIYNLQTLTSHFTTAIMACLKTGSDLLIAFGMLGLMIVSSTAVFVVVLACISTLAFGYLIFFRKSVISLGRLANEGSADALQFSQEAIRGKTEIRFLKKRSYFIQKYEQSLKQVMRASVGLDMHGIAPRVLIEYAIVLIVVGILFFVGQSDIDVKKYGPLITLYALAIVRLIPIASSLTTQIMRFRAVQNSIQRLHDDVFDDDAKQSSNCLVDEGNEPAPLMSMVFDKVSFSYNEQVPILKDLSITISKGDIVGIYGPSGVGKSTFLNLVLGLIMPKSGAIRINGDVRLNPGCNDVGGMGYLPQDPIVLNRSISDNVTLGEVDGYLLTSAVTKSLDEALLGNLVSAFGDNINKPLGDSGEQISAGQRQRLAFARILFHARKVLVLDESTNALDLKTEEALLSRLIESGSIETAFIVSHRPSTLRHCTRILAFSDNGIQQFENVTKFVSDLG